MRKVPTVFDRDWDGDRSRVINEVNPDCVWVTDGEGVATRKIDGMCCAIIDGVFYKRREVKANKPAPADFILEQKDEKTGKAVGWVPVGGGKEDAYFREAYGSLNDDADGTYELVGPKSQGGVEGYASHTLVKHDVASLGLDEEPPRDFDGLRDWLEGKDMEGLVWHHPDGRMAKIKLRDFGLNRGG